MRAFVLALAIVLGTGMVADAQPNKQTQAQRIQKIKERIRAMRAFKLTEALKLDEKTGGQLFPVLAKYDDENDKILQERIDIRKRLEQSASGKDPKAANKAIDDLVANQRALLDAQDKRLAELRKILTPQQIAKMIVVVSNFDQRIENRLRQVINQQQAKGAKKAARPDTDDEDDDDDDAPPPRKKAP